jgi:hypothetical protein
MFRIYLVNFGYYLFNKERSRTGRFETLGEALDCAKSKGFEARIDDECGSMVASWSPIGGTQFHRCIYCGMFGRDAFDRSYWSSNPALIDLNYPSQRRKD